MKKYVGMALLAIGLCHDPVALADLLTLNCLVGYENDRHDALCAVISPDQRQGVIEAQRRFQERNRAALQELKAACESRLRRAYGNDETRIQIERNKAKGFRDAEDKKFLENPNRNNMINCQAYAKDVGEQKIERWLIDMTLNSPAKPIDWSTITNGK